VPQTLPSEIPHTPDLLQAPPSTALAEELLGDEIDINAETITVPITMPKAELAAKLYTTPELLDTFTQGLPDPVPAHYIVVIPRNYRASAGETLTTIAESLDLSVAQLRTANPDLLPDTPLSGETQVKLPNLYTTPQASTLAAIAVELKTTVKTLITLNPELRPDQALPAGQLLVIPLTR
jgi:LysM repeat protein